MTCIFEKVSVAYYRVVRCGGDVVIYILKVYVSGSIPDKLTEVSSCFGPTRKIGPSHSISPQLLPSKITL